MMVTLMTTQEILHEIKDLPIEEQIKRMKAQVLNLGDVYGWEAATEFVKDPRVKAWIKANVDAINASVKKPKSRGY